MTTSIGSSLQNPSSTRTNGPALSLQNGLGICVLAGVAAALVDLYVHIPLHMPGWRGLMTMGLLVAAQQVSGRAWGASAAAFAASLTSLALAGPPRFSTLAFLIPGLVIDGVCLVALRWKGNALVAALAGALANVAKFAVTLIGFTSFAHRDGGAPLMLLPWFSHFGFGLCGGLLAGLLASLRGWKFRSSHAHESD